MDKSSMKFHAAFIKNTRHGKMFENYFNQQELFYLFNIDDCCIVKLSTRKAA
jgi:hypothetical protein